MRLFPLVLAALLATSFLAWTKPATRPSPFGEVKTDAKKPARARVKTMRAAHLLDINLATAGQREERPGIGKEDGEKAVQNPSCRDKDELVEKNVTPDGVCDSLD